MTLCVAESTSDSMRGFGSDGIAALVSACHGLLAAAVTLSSDVVPGHSNTLCGQLCRMFIHDIVSMSLA